MKEFKAFAIQNDKGEFLHEGMTEFKSPEGEQFPTGCTYQDREHAEFYTKDGCEEVKELLVLVLDDGDAVLSVPGTKVFTGAVIVKDNKFYHDGTNEWISFVEKFHDVIWGNAITAQKFISEFMQDEIDGLEVKDVRVIVLK